MSTTEGLDEVVEEAVATDEGGADLDETTVDEAGDVEEGEEGVDESEVIAIGEDEITEEEYQTLKSQQMMHKDYTQKTQALAQERREMTETIRQETVGDLTAHIEVLKEMKQELLDDVDVDDLTNSEFQAREKKLKKWDKQISEAEKGAVKANQKTQAELDAETISLANAMPHWSSAPGVYDDAQMKDDVQLIIKTANDFGFDVTADPDHRLYRAFYEAAQFRALKSKEDLTTKRKIKKSKATKPAAKKSSAKKSRADLFYGT